MQKANLLLRVARNIRDRREAKHLSQGDLAKLLGVTVRYVNMLECKPRNLSLGSLVKIAEALNVDAAELVCDEKYLSNRRAAVAELAIDLLQRYLKDSSDREQTAGKNDETFPG
jgi:transcriptional regulator with XRE-family HTH domain